MMNDKILRELENNKNDKITIEAQTERYKEKFAKELLNGAGNEMTHSLKYGGNPVKMKKPLGIRIRESFKRFVNRFINVF